VDRQRCSSICYPTRELADVVRELARPRGARSLASHLQSRLATQGRENGRICCTSACHGRRRSPIPDRLGAAIKALPIPLLAPRPLDEAISSAGGVVFEALDEKLMIRDLPGVFCAGEMLDWEAPTGGYLLSACLASGRAAGLGVLAWLNDQYRSADTPTDSSHERQS
jgi:predicted flavoprotein YhiN